jgi:ABC-2 type transport system permease protein
MSNWMGAIRNEWDIIWMKKTTKLLLALTALLPIGLGWVLSTVNLSFGLLPVGSSGIPLFTLSLLIAVYLPLILFMLVSDGLAFQPHILKAFFLRPIHRYKLFSAKLIAISALIAIHMGLALLVSILSGWMFQQWLGWDSVLQAILAYGMSYMAMLMWIMFGSFIVQWFKSQSGAMVSLILVYLLSYVFVYVYPDAAAISPAHYHHWHTLAQAGASAIQPILYGITYICSAGLLFFLLGLVMFERRNL